MVPDGLPVVSGDAAVRAFEKAGWSFVRQTGSHMMLTKPTAEQTLSVPKHKELGPGLLRKLIRRAGLTVDEFRALLD